MISKYENIENSEIVLGALILKHLVKSGGCTFDQLRRHALPEDAGIDELLNSVTFLWLTESIEVRGYKLLPVKQGN